MSKTNIEWTELNDEYMSAFSLKASSCWVKLEYNRYQQLSTNVVKYFLPVYPEEVTNTISTNYASYDIVGRSGQISAYNSTADVISSFSLHLHRELLGINSDDSNEIDKIVSLIEAAQYPLYDTVASALYSPIITYKFGDTVISGKQTSVSTKWGGPKINGKYMDVILTISVTNLPHKVLNSTHIMNSNPRGFNRWIDSIE